MTSEQNIIERVLDMVQQGKLSVDQGNIEIVKMLRYRIVTRLPRDVRSALNGAVKSGELMYLKKDGLKPAAYYLKDFKFLAEEARSKIANDTIRSISKCCC